MADGYIALDFEKKYLITGEVLSFLVITPNESGRRNIVRKAIKGQ